MAIWSTDKPASFSASLRHCTASATFWRSAPLNLLLAGGGDQYLLEQTEDLFALSHGLGAVRHLGYLGETDEAPYPVQPADSTH